MPKAVTEGRKFSAKSAFKRKRESNVFSQDDNQNSVNASVATVSDVAVSHDVKKKKCADDLFISSGSQSSSNDLPVSNIAVSHNTKQKIDDNELFLPSGSQMSSNNLPASNVAVSHNTKQEIDDNEFFLPSCSQNSSNDLPASNVAVSLNIKQEIDDNDDLCLPSGSQNSSNHVPASNVAVSHNIKQEIDDSDLFIPSGSQNSVNHKPVSNEAVSHSVQQESYANDGSQNSINHIPVSNTALSDNVKQESYADDLFILSGSQNKVKQRLISKLTASHDLESENHVNDMHPAGQAFSNNQISMIFAEIRKLQKLLLAILHGYNCQNHKMENTLPYCKGMKLVLNHIKHCSAGDLCQVPACYSSRCILNHLKGCKHMQCSLYNIYAIQRKLMSEYGQNSLHQAFSNLPASHYVGLESSVNDVSTVGQAFSNYLLPVNFIIVGRMQKCLLSLLHADECQKHTNQANLNLCKRMKYGLNHMRNCLTGELCNEPYCCFYRWIIEHFKRCKNRNCHVCIIYILWANFKERSSQNSSNHVPASNVAVSHNIKQEIDDSDLFIPFGSQNSMNHKPVSNEAVSHSVQQESYANDGKKLLQKSKNH